MARFFSKEYTRNGALFLDSFLYKNTVKIPPHYWREINGSFDKDEIKDALINLIRKHALPVPGAFNKKEGETIALQDFKRLQRLDSRKIIQKAVGRITTRHDYKYPISNYFLQTSNVGNDASDYFQREYRVACGTVKFDSPASVWADNDKLHYCLNALWSLKPKEVNETYLFAAMALRQYAASQFRVSSAKAIYELFNSERVLDTSAGWGDRFAGFSAASCTKQYLGIDPNSKLHPGYNAASKLYNTGKDAVFFPSPAEDVILPRNYFDVMFTSPPYFETERYSEEATQSWKRYGKFSAWLNDFLYVVVRNAYNSLKPGGYLAMNIADLGVTYDETGICDSMNDYISTFKGAHYVGCLGLRLAVRPHTGIEKEMPGGTPIFIEPVWVWRKGKDDSMPALVKRFNNRKGSTNYLVSKNKRVKLIGD